MRDFTIRQRMLVHDGSGLRAVASMNDLLILLGEQLGDLAEAIRAEIAPPA